MKLPLRRAVILLALIGLALPAARALAQKDYPNRSIRMIVPFSPGGSNDIMGRLVAGKWTESMGEQVVVDNRPGATGIIGTDIAAKSAPDGYTVLVMSLTFAVSPSIRSKLPYDTEKDLVPLTLIASAPLILVVHPSLPVKSVKEFIAYAKANPGKLNFGSGGLGSTPHLAGEMLKTMAGIRMTHIPYKGGGPALGDLIGGQIQFMLENIPSTLPHVQSGRLRVLAVTSKQRSPTVPEVPTLDEAGLTGFDLTGWNGLFMPAGTPRAIMDRLHAETVKALAAPDVKQQLARMSAVPGGEPPARFAAFVKAEIRKWATIAKDAGLKID
jgi:tripartite-type tricarboxylate transporter receptor subunit TctC